MAEHDRPNVIFVLTDDQGPWAAGCCGNPEIRTPNTDRLAADGLHFENFFCSSPVCSPARASLLTGRVPSQHGVHDWIRDGNMPPDPARYLEGFTCYTDVLAENGYTVGLSEEAHRLLEEEAGLYGVKDKTKALEILLRDRREQRRKRSRK